MKKILFLGAAPTQIPPIQYALDQGYYTITCDYLPENPGHVLAHESHNVSTTDKEAVLALAQKLEIDGIVAYASDPAAPTAAYVAEKMGLPGNPYRSVEILARKDLFREFLAENGFNVPKSRSFYDLRGVAEWIDEIALPVFVKPVDSSGSKGVTRLEDVSSLFQAFEHALYYSREKKVVIEEAIEREGYQVDSDVFMSQGKVVFWLWGDQHQDFFCHPYAPVAISFPTVLAPNIQLKAKNKIESILKKLNFETGAFNVEFIVDNTGEIWIIEIGPRNGGNLIPQVIKYISNIDTIAATVDESIGKKFNQNNSMKLNGYWSSYVLHAQEDGEFKEILFSERIKNYIVEKNIQVKSGDRVRKFSGSHDSLGAMILNYPTRDKMLEILNNIEEYILVVVKKNEM